MTIKLHNTSKVVAKRTPWFPRSTNPVHLGVYECSVKISSSVPPLLFSLEWDGKGFLVPTPMVVRHWRGLTKKGLADLTGLRPKKRQS